MASETSLLMAQHILNGPRPRVRIANILDRRNEEVQALRSALDDMCKELQRVFGADILRMDEYRKARALLAEPDDAD